MNRKLKPKSTNCEVIQELLHYATLNVTMDTYVQAVTDDKRKAQSKVVEMLLIEWVRRSSDMAFSQSEFDLAVLV